MNVKTLITFLMIAMMLITFTGNCFADTPATQNDIKCVDTVQAETWGYVFIYAVVCLAAMLL